MSSSTALCTDRPTNIRHRLGFADSIVLAPPNAEWQAGRKLIHKHFGSVGLKQYHIGMELGARQFVHKVLEGTSAFVEAAQR